MSCNDAARMNAMHDYVSNSLESEGYLSGLPNFHEAIHDGTHVYGAFLFKKEAVEFRDVPVNELGNPDRRDVRAMFTAVASYASKNGFVAGYPTFHHGGTEENKVYGTILFKDGTVDWEDIKASDLGNPQLEDVGAMMRAANDYVSKKGEPYKGAFPTFHHGGSPEDPVYGIYFVKDEAVDWRDIPSSLLDLPRYEKIFCEIKLPDIDRIIDVTLDALRSAGVGLGNQGYVRVEELNCEGKNVRFRILLRYKHEAFSGAPKIKAKAYLEGNIDISDPISIADDVKICSGLPPEFGEARICISAKDLAIILASIFL